MKKLKQVKTFSNNLCVERHVHRHVYLDVNIEKKLRPHPLYWRLDDPKFNLIEIGLENPTGRMASFTVTNYNGPALPIPLMTESVPMRSSEGVPGFEVGLWQIERDPDDFSAYYYNVPGRCLLQLGDQDLRVELFPEPISYHIVANDWFVCEFNAASELCAIRVTNLNPAEVKVVTENLNR